MDAPHSPSRPSLSHRELQVLAMLASGARNKIIAAALGLSEHTVKRHVARLMLKLHVASRGEAAFFYRTTMRRAGEPVGAHASLVRDLTVRERDVLARVAGGASNKRIACELALSPNTVKRHTANILEKLGVHSRVHAAALLHESA